MGDGEIEFSISDLSGMNLEARLPGTAFLSV